VAPHPSGPRPAVPTTRRPAVARPAGRKGRRGPDPPGAALTPSRRRPAGARWRRPTGGRSGPGSRAPWRAGADPGSTPSPAAGARPRGPWRAGRAHPLLRPAARDRSLDGEGEVRPAPRRAGVLRADALADLGARRRAAPRGRDRSRPAIASPPGPRPGTRSAPRSSSGAGPRRRRRSPRASAPTSWMRRRFGSRWSASCPRAIPGCGPPSRRSRPASSTAARLAGEPLESHRRRPRTIPSEAAVSLRETARRPDDLLRRRVTRRRRRRRRRSPRRGRYPPTRIFWTAIATPVMLSPAMRPAASTIAKRAAQPGATLPATRAATAPMSIEIEL